MKNSNIGCDVCGKARIKHEGGIWCPPVLDKKYFRGLVMSFCAKFKDEFGMKIKMVEHSGPTEEIHFTLGVYSKNSYILSMIARINTAQDSSVWLEIDDVPSSFGGIIDDFWIKHVKSYNKELKVDVWFTKD